MSSVYTVNDLRSDIHSTELAVAHLRTDTGVEKVSDLLQRMDRIVAGYQNLHTRTIDLRAEQTRIETLHNILSEKGRVIVRALAAFGGVAGLRAQISPPQDNWWWYLDEKVAAQNAQQRRRWLTRLLWGTGLAAVLVVVYMLFLRPDEATRLHFDYTNEALMQLQNQEYEAALENYERALELQPDHAESALMVGLLYEVLSSAQAETYYAQAEKLYQSRVLYLSMRSQKYNLLAWDRDEEYALLAVKEDDQFALAYLVLGSAYERRGQTWEAIEALQKGADLAREQNQDELYVIISSRLAMLLQRP